MPTSHVCRSRRCATVLEEAEAEAEVEEAVVERRMMLQMRRV